MPRTFVRQITQIRNSDLYDDTIVPSQPAFETAPVEVERDLNNLRSIIHELRDVRSSDWWRPLTAATGFESGTARGVQNLNQALHNLERKRLLKRVRMTGVDVTGGASQLVVLGVGKLPSVTTAAVGAVTTTGTIVAQASVFGTASALNVVTGSNALQPKNLVRLVSGTTGDAINDAQGREIFGLLQSESGTNGHTISDIGPNRVQISYVVRNATNDGLILAAAGSMSGVIFDYAYIRRDALADCPEEAFLGDDFADAGASIIGLQTAYNNQGSTPVNVVTDTFIDLEGPGLKHCWRDDLEAELLCIVEGSAGGTSEVKLGTAVDVFNVDAILNNFENGASFDTGTSGTTINIGVTANQIDSGGVLQINSAGSSNLNLLSANRLNLSDSYRVASTWSLANGIALAHNAADWNAFETIFGETSLLAAITQAGATTSRARINAVVITNVAADIDVSGPANDNNISVNLGSLAAGSFVNDYDFYVNGVLLRNGANAAANEDVYPGTSLANGQIRFEFPIRITGATPDVITVVKWI